MAGKNTSDRTNCKGQLALNEPGVRRLSRIVRSQRNQTLAQITTQLNQGASRTVSKRTVQRSWASRAVDPGEYNCSMHAIGLHVLPGQENTENGL
ncbi:hypothetical protein AVEN_79677-1 [Araneus ventricosus]|uniref:Transposase Tc1-like domain-containing protein n=1 Tax=Araneus ventricosus TaxID=182803 RepID=A0A4Y2UAW8_ARAVE|nr:hypothetical protein AVEN_79677-1 [Araneus ventricosus]